MPPLPLLLLAVDAPPGNSAAVYWLHLPVLIVLVSLVYGATRFDDWPNIFRESVRWMIRLTVFLFTIVAVLYVLASWI
jgi:hypothetical protein